MNEAKRETTDGSGPERESINGRGGEQKSHRVDGNRQLGDAGGPSSLPDSDSRTKSWSRRRWLGGLTAAGGLATTGCLRFIDDDGASDGGVDVSEDGVDLSTGGVEFAFRPDDLDSQTIVSTAERNGRNVLDGRVTFNVWGPDGERLEHTMTNEAVGIDGGTGYRLDRRFAFDGDRPMVVRHIVTGLDDRPGVRIRTELHNVGDSAVELSRPDNHVHDGLILTRLPKLADVSGEYRYYVGGNGVYAAAETDYWQAHFLGEDEPFVTNFDADVGITTGLIDGPTTPTRPVTRRIDDGVGGVDLCAGGIEIQSDATATYTSIFAVHDGGSAVPERPRRLTNAVAEGAD